LKKLNIFKMEANMSLTEKIYKRDNELIYRCSILNHTIDIVRRKNAYNLKFKTILHYPESFSNKKSKVLANSDVILVRKIKNPDFYDEKLKQTLFFLKNDIVSAMVKEKFGEIEEEELAILGKVFLDNMKVEYDMFLR